MTVNARDTRIYSFYRHLQIFLWINLVFLEEKALRLGFSKNIVRKYIFILFLQDFIFIVFFTLSLPKNGVNKIILTVYSILSLKYFVLKLNEEWFNRHYNYLTLLFRKFDLKEQCIYFQDKKVNRECSYQTVQNQ